MHRMSLAESAVLLGFHSVRMSLLILGHVVIALLAFCACQCDLCAHDFHLHLINFVLAWPLLYFGHKKKTCLPFARLLYHILGRSSMIFLRIWADFLGVFLRFFRLFFEFYRKHTNSNC